MQVFDSNKAPHRGPFLFANVMCGVIDSCWIHAKYDVWQLKVGIKHLNREDSMTRPIKVSFNMAILVASVALANHFLPVAQVTMQSMTQSISEITGK